MIDRKSALPAVSDPLRTVVCCLIIACALLVPTTARAATCTWTGATDNTWGTAGNWDCGHVPTGDDVIFNGVSTPAPIITGVAAATITSLQVTNGAQVSLASTGAATLTINGAGTGLQISAGSKLTLSGATPNLITIALATGSSGTIAGAMTVAGGAHRLTAFAASPVTFQSGATFTADTGFSGNAFGTTSLNSVVFASGSTYIFKAGSNPFGAGQPSSVVVFQTGSTYSHQASGTPAFSGRTYANVEMNASGTTAAPTGGSPVSIDNLTVTAGTMNIGMTGLLSTIKGNIAVANGAALNFSPATAGTLTLNGPSTQTISGAGTLTFGANQNLGVNNVNGITLQRALTLPGALALTAGDVTTGANVLTLGGTLTGTGEIVGNARRTAFVAATPYAFSNARTTVNFSTLTVAPTDLTFTLVKTTPAGLPLAIARTYSIAATGTPAFTATLQLGYLQSEVDAVAGLSEATLAANKSISGVWAAQPGSVDAANDFVTATGVTSFSDWGIAPPPTPTLTINNVSQAEGDSGDAAFTFTVTVFPLASSAVTFDIATANGTATEPSDYAVRSLTAQTIPLGSGTYTFAVQVHGDTTFETDETFFVNVTNMTGATLGDGQGLGTIINDEATLIHTIQGSGATSPMTGQIVKIRGIVVGDYQGASPNLGGFYVQEEDADANAEGDPATSEGIFVYSNTAVTTGDRVEVTGTVTEYTSSSGGLTSSLTELGSVSSVQVLSSGNPLPSAASVSFPVAALGDLERFEGMRVSFPQTLTVIENYELARYGSVSLSGTGRLPTPTHGALPGAAAIALADLNDRSRVVLDDASTFQNSDPVPYPTGGLSASNTLRDGATVSGLVAVFDDRYGAYRVQPAGAVTFTNSNPRPAPPAAPGTRIRAVSLNTLNYFNGDGLGGGFPTARGANTPAEFTRQRNKTIAAMTALSADVYGLMEIENDATAGSEYGAIEDLVDGLNAATAAGTYAFIDTGVMGTDAIRSAIVYKPARLTPVGAFSVLNQSVDPTFEDYGNRPTIAQTFSAVSSGARFTFVVNHLRSKGSCGSATGSNVDSGDGQGCWNLTRTNAAKAIVNWLATDPTGSGDPDFLLVGDMNSYRLENPITAFTSGGLTNLVDTFGGGYSYVFSGEAGYLDHALGSSTLTAQVAAVAHWHNNADEPVALDYNVEFKSAGQVTSFYDPGPYRSSDHDPVFVDIDLAVNAAPTVDAGGPYAVSIGFTTTLTATLNDPNGDPLAVAWDLDNNGTYETVGNPVTFSAVALAPGAYTVGVRATETASGGLSATDTATVNVVLGPAITSPAFVSFTIGTPGSFTITTTGFPTPALTLTGALPAGLTFTDNGNGTGTISGTPAVGSSGNFSVTVRASNGVGTPFVQTLAITILDTIGIAAIPALDGVGLGLFAFLVALGGALALGRRLS